MSQIPDWIHMFSLITLCMAIKKYNNRNYFIELNKPLHTLEQDIFPQNNFQALKKKKIKNQTPTFLVSVSICSTSKYVKSMFTQLKYSVIRDFQNWRKNIRCICTVSEEKKSATLQVCHLSAPQKRKKEMLDRIQEIQENLLQEQAQISGQDP